METLTINIAVPADLAARYDEIAKTTGQSRDQLMEAILWDHLAFEDEDRARIRMSMAEADRGEFTPEDEIEAIFTRYGGPDRAEHRARIDRELRDEYGLPPCE